MNVIAIDPSLNNTAVVVNEKLFTFTNKTLAFTTSGKYTKWFELASPFVNYNFIEYKALEDYSSNEMNKFNVYDETTSQIKDVVLENINAKNDIKVYIEGYSFSSMAGPLIDLVTFGTLLRAKINEITQNINIISPTSLKLEAAKLTYLPIRKGKKVIRSEYRNNEGVAGGSFNKIHMFKALIDNNNLQSEWVNFLRAYKKDVLNFKNIAKPLEDINDAYLMYEIFKNS